MRKYSATVGLTDGNINAAIITTPTARNHPRAPRPVHGPLSIPRIRPAVHHHPAAASANSSAMSPSRARAAVNAGARPPPRGTSTRTARITRSSRPGEVGLRKAGLALVPDAERVDARALRLRHREVRTDRMEHAGEPH